MLRSVILALALVGAVQTNAQAEDSGQLTIQLEGLAPQGAVMLQLFNSEAGYDGGEGVAARRIEITGATAELAFDDLAPGQYAFRLFHDVNGDGRMNTNPFGIPTEPFAFSNNARGQFGPARWEAAAFTLNAGANVQQIDVGGAR
jgi:uncharacterized protein (DUF2141 family)